MSPTVAPGARRLTLFVTVLSLFLVIAILLVASITAANFLQSREFATKAAIQMFEATIAQVNEKRKAFFAPVYLVTRLLRDDPSFHNSSNARGAHERLIMSALSLNPQISAVYVGYNDGDYFQILSVSDAEVPFIRRLGGPDGTRFAVQSIVADATGARRSTWRFLDATHKFIAEVTEPRIDYDPRQRGWFADAKAQPQTIIQTPPYVFATTGEIGVTIAGAFDRGVVGSDITLDRLMSYVNSVRPNDNHRLVAFDDKQRLLAHFNPDRLLKRVGAGANSFEFATTADLVDPVVLETMKIFKERGPFQFATFDVTGDEYIATVTRHTAEDGNHFYVLYAAPFSDYRESLSAAARRSLPAALVIFLLALPSIIFFARSISRPIVQLSKEARRIQSFELGEPIKLTSHVWEISTLIRSMSGMKGTLREVTKFVPKALVKDVLQSEQAASVGGTTRRISVLFTDVKDFTTISQHMPAEALMKGLSEYFEELASLIIAEGGTVDKFIGDAIFAFWNAPLPIDRYERLACETALRCSAASKRLNARWIEQGKQPWHTRLGVHVGDAVVGNVGSSDRIDYTAIGDTVNIASRLEGLNKFYGTSILASGDIVKACSNEFLFRRIDCSIPKGSEAPLDVFELLGMRDGQDELGVTSGMLSLVQQWDQFYRAYSSGDLGQSLEALKVFSQNYPGDAVAGIYQRRIDEHLKGPLPASWNPVMRFEEK